jgi:hypothetical protein
MHYDGLDDEELMTVQGLDDYGEYGDYAGYGALYQTPDGSLYQMQGLEGSLDESLYDAECLEDDIGGYGDAVPGEVRLGSDGRLYQWVQGYDGLGDPVGFWSLIPGIAKTVLPIVASKVAPHLRRFLPRAIRGLRQFAPVARPMSVVQPTPVLQPTAVVPPAAEQPAPEADGNEDLTGFGHLFQAPDGSLYGLDDVADEERLADDEFVRGLDSEGYGDDQELRDTEGYVRGEGESGCCCTGVRGIDDIDAYVPAEVPQTRTFVRPVVAPDMWRPLW